MIADGGEHPPTRREVADLILRLAECGQYDAVDELAMMLGRCWADTDPARIRDCMNGAESLL